MKICWYFFFLFSLFSCYLNAQHFEPFPSTQITTAQWNEYFKEVSEKHSSTKQDLIGKKIVIFSNPLSGKVGTVYAFTTPGHSAHPAWIAQQPQERSGNVHMIQVGFYAGSKREFQKLFNDYSEMTDKALLLRRNIERTGKSSRPEITSAKVFSISLREVVNLDVQNFAYEFLNHIDSMSPDSYVLISERMKSAITLTEWLSQAKAQNERLGNGLGRHFHRLTWYPNTDEVYKARAYVALDFSGEFEKSFIHCGYIVVAFVNDNQYEIIHFEQNTISREHVNKMEAEQVDAFKKKHCR
jgi:Protein of unknown function (DUF4019)